MARGNEGSAVTDADQQMLEKREEEGRRWEGSEGGRREGET